MESPPAAPARGGPGFDRCAADAVRENRRPCGQAVPPQAAEKRFGGLHRRAGKLFGGTEKPRKISRFNNNKNTMKSKHI